MIDNPRRTPAKPKPLRAAKRGGRGKHRWRKRGESFYFDCVNPGCGEFVYDLRGRKRLPSDLRGVVGPCPVGRERRDLITTAAKPPKSSALSERHPGRGR